MFVSRDPHHRADNVGGNWHKSRQAVGRRTVSEHRRRGTICRRSDIRYLPVEIVGESPGSATGAPSPPLPNPLLMTRHRDAWSRPVSTLDLQKCFRFDRTKRCIVFNAPIQLSRAASVRDLLKRRSCPLARRLAERHSESYHPPEDRRTRRMGVKQGRDHVIEARSHHRSIVTQGIFFAQCRTDEAVAETGRLKISSKLFNVELSPGPSSLCSVDGHFNLGGVKGPGHQPVVRRTTWSGDDVN